MQPTRLLRARSARDAGGGPRAADEAVPPIEFGAVRDRERDGVRTFSCRDTSRTLMEQVACPRGTDSTDRSTADGCLRAREACLFRPLPTRPHDESRAGCRGSPSLLRDAYPGFAWSEVAT